MAPIPTRGPAGARAGNPQRLQPSNAKNPVMPPMPPMGGGGGMPGMM